MDITACSDRLQLLRAADPHCRAFGAASHRYRLQPPATEDEARAFEEKHRVRLPEEYRGFLTGLGDGGAGPCYGLFPLGIFWDNPDPAQQEGAIGDLAKPFPHEAAWNAGEDDWGASPDIDEDEAAWRAWRGEYFRNDLIDGALPICHEGCGYFFLPIITGAGRGRIRLDGRAADDGIMPVTGGGGTPVTFGRWYANWLEVVSAELGLPPLATPPRP